jgi:hypothetical protein
MATPKLVPYWLKPPLAHQSVARALVGALQDPAAPWRPSWPPPDPTHPPAQPRAPARPVDPCPSSSSHACSTHHPSISNLPPCHREVVAAAGPQPPTIPTPRSMLRLNPHGEAFAIDKHLHRALDTVWIAALESHPNRLSLPLQDREVVNINSPAHHPKGHHQPLTLHQIFWNPGEADPSRREDKV